MALSEEQEAIFIEVWQENSCLYDIGCKSYSNKHEKKRAVMEIADKMNISADAVTKKITSLRTQYSRLMKALPSGSGGNSVRTSHQSFPTTSLFPLLTFFQ